MIRRLIILLLIVGCEDEEEPMGLCYFLTQLDNLTASNGFDNYFESFHWECKDSYTQSECCEDIRAEEICPAAYTFICYGNEMNVDGSNNFEFPQSWIWKENTTCEEFEYPQNDLSEDSLHFPYYSSICSETP